MTDVDKSLTPADCQSERVLLNGFDLYGSTLRQATFLWQVSSPAFEDNDAHLALSGDVFEGDVELVPLVVAIFLGRTNQPKSFKEVEIKTSRPDWNIIQDLRFYILKRL